MLIIIGTGVEFGSALVPDVACCSIASVNDFGSPPIFIFIGCCATASELAASSRLPQHLYTRFLPLEKHSTPQTHVRGRIGSKEKLRF